MIGYFGPDALVLFEVFGDGESNVGLTTIEDFNLVGIYDAMLDSNFFALFGTCDLNLLGFEIVGDEDRSILFQAEIACIFLWFGFLCRR